MQEDGDERVVRAQPFPMRAAYITDAAVFLVDLVQRQPHGQRAARLEHEAVNAESDSARVRALELLGKTHDVGLFVERIETDNGDRSPDELRRELQDKLTALLGRSG